ncbi:MAG: Mor transcription activator family protein [Desulfomonilaceae bacterium]
MPEEIPSQFQWLLDEKLDTAILPEEVRRLFELIGRAATARFVAEYGGLQLYIPRLKNTFAAYRASRIREEFNGANHNALSRKYHLSVRHIYEILKEGS